MYTRVVTNPANGKVIGTVPDMCEDDVNQAIETASSAFQSWRKTTAKVEYMTF